MSKNSKTKKIQELLNHHGYRVVVDGIPGRKTNAAIRQFQSDRGLYDDGIVGQATWRELSIKDNFRDFKLKLGFKKLKVSDFPGSHGVTYLREDAYSSFKNVYDEITAKGGLITSSGGRRLLQASVGKNRSKTSLHYLGLAHDLNVRSGMVDPSTDPYVITQDPKKKGKWIVWVRAKGGEEMTLEGYTYCRMSLPVTGRFLNLTRIMNMVGWKGIPARSSFFISKKENDMAAEWWHFQYEKPLYRGNTFGQELLKSFTREKVERYSVWDYRDKRWKIDWF